MKNKLSLKSLSFILLAGLSTAPWALAHAADAKAGPRAIHKLVIVALARDGARAAAVEAEVKQDFVAHGVNADSLRTLVGQSTMTVSSVIEQIRAGGYDSLLCMAPRKTIQIEPLDKSGKVPGMDACLKSFVTGALPTGEPLDIYPVVAEAPALQTTGTPDPLRTPIPTNPAAAPLIVLKGTLRVFDTTSKRQIWQASINVKMPAELQSGFQNKLLAHEVWQVISKSDLLPKS